MNPPLRCRLGWHHYEWFRTIFQPKASIWYSCLRCGKELVR